MATRGDEEATVEHLRGTLQLTYKEFLMVQACLGQG